MEYLKEISFLKPSDHNSRDTKLVVSEPKACEPLSVLNVFQCLYLFSLDGGDFFRADF